MGVRNDCVFSTLWPTVTRYGISWLRRLVGRFKMSDEANYQSPIADRPARRAWCCTALGLGLNFNFK